MFKLKTFRFTNHVHQLPPGSQLGLSGMCGRFKHPKEVVRYDI